LQQADRNSSRSQQLLSANACNDIRMPLLLRKHNHW